MTREEFQQLKVGDRISRIESNGIGHYEVVEVKDEEITVNPLSDLPNWRRHTQAINFRTARDITLANPL